MERYEQSVNAISAVMSRHSERDTCDALFAFQMWLPNTSAVVRLELLWGIFLSLERASLPAGDTIHSYSDFSGYCQALVDLLPQATDEDFLPDFDWGDVWFTIEGEHYRMLYGGNFAYPYDYAHAFWLLHSPFSEDYLAAVKKSPVDDLRSTLAFLDALIGAITAQPEPPIEVAPGHLEVPTRRFWLQCLDFLSAVRAGDGHVACLGRNYARVGSMTRDDLDADRFLSLVGEGKAVDATAVESGFGPTPILPRNLLHNLYNEWGKLLLTLPAKVLASAEQRLALSFGSYLAPRLSEQILPYVRTSLSGPLFHLGISGNKCLLLVRFENPFAAIDLEATGSAFTSARTDFEKRPRHLYVGPQEAHLGTEDGTGGADPPSLRFVSLILHLSTDGRIVRKPENFRGTVMFLVDFLAVLDSIADLSELFSFFAFQELQASQIPRGFLSDLDVFAAFKQTGGVLTTGALEYHSIFLDPHGGSDYRFQTLRDFCAGFPLLPSFKEPRHWRIEQATEGSVGLTSRGQRIVAHVAFKGKSAVTVKLDFAHTASWQEAKILNLLAECLMHNCVRYKDHLFASCGFGEGREVSVSVIAQRLLSDDPWQWQRNSLDSYDLCCDVDRCSEAFLEPPDRQLESKLLLSFLEQACTSLSGSEDLLRAIDGDRSLAPGFKLYEVQMQHDMPRTQWQPISQFESRSSLRMLAHACRKAGIAPGEYDGKAAVGILNAIRRVAVQEIESLLRGQSYVATLEQIVVSLETVSTDYRHIESRVQAAATQHVEYDRATTLQEKRSEYMRVHQAARYLLCKAVHLLGPDGVEGTSHPDVKVAIAFALEILHLYHLSDQLHYGGLTSHQIRVEEDYAVRAIPTEEFELAMERFGLMQAKDRIRTKSREFEAAQVIEDVTAFQSSLDEASLADLGFSLGHMLECLSALRFWASVNGIENFTGFVSVSNEEICSFLSRQTNADGPTSAKIVEFLSLRPGEVYCTLSGKTPFVHPDVPVWEHAKRFARPEIRPLIPNGSGVSFGPGMVYDAMRIWAGNIAGFTFPYEVPWPATRTILARLEEKAHRMLVVRVEDIIRRFTTNVIREIFPHKLCQTTTDIGDVDVLAFDGETLFNIECKFIRDSFCVKDAVRDRRKIFQDGAREKCYLTKVEDRAQFLERNAHLLIDRLGWTLTDMPLRVRSLFVTNSFNFWTVNPPVETHVEFVHIEDLHDHLGTGSGSVASR